MTHRVWFFSLAAVALISVLSACGGGGSSGGGGSVPPMTPTPIVSSTTSPTTTPSTVAVTGTVTEYTSGAAIAGAAVTIGAAPSTTCTGFAACAAPVAPLVTTMTNSSGSFTLAVPTNAGAQWLMIGNDANPIVTQTYAILHRSLTIAHAAIALGTIHLAALSADESAWESQLITDRATIAYPTTGPVVVDEYLEENARAEAQAVASGAMPYADSTENVYLANYLSEPGSIAEYSGGGALAVDTPAGAWAKAEAEFFAEKANCLNGDWRTCPYTSTTGHYINLATDDVVWVGLAESASSTPVGTPYQNQWVYPVLVMPYGLTQRTGSDVIRSVPK